MAEFYASRLYVTYRCNSQCTYCDIGRARTPDRAAEIPLEGLKVRIAELRNLGVRQVDVTGGEPLLRPDAAEIGRIIRSHEMHAEVTTNGLCPTASAVLAARAFDVVNLSLDTLDRARYRHIRGVDGVSRAVSTARALAVEHAAKSKLMMVVTSDNVDEIESLIEFGGTLGLPVALNPVFSFGDRNVNTPASDAPLLRHLYHPFAIVNLYALRMRDLRHGEHSCMAARQILTLAPDGSLLLPCYHGEQPGMSIPPAELSTLSDAVRSPRFIAARRSAGSLDACRGCRVLPYLGLSISHKFTRLFLYQAFSEELIKLKRFLHPYRAVLETSPDDCLREFNVLDCLLRSGLADPVRPRSGPLAAYAASRWPADSASRAWSYQLSPHTVVKFFYAEILPYLRGAHEAGAIEDAAWFEVLRDLFLFQICWWRYFLGRYFLLAEGAEHERGLGIWLERFLVTVLKLLPSSSSSQRARDLLFTAGMMLGVEGPLYHCRRTTAESFPEEELAARYLLANESAPESFRSLFSRACPVFADPGPRMHPNPSGAVVAQPTTGVDP